MNTRPRPNRPRTYGLVGSSGSSISTPGRRQSGSTYGTTSAAKTGPWTLCGAHAARASCFRDASFVADSLCEKEMDEKARDLVLLDTKEMLSHPGFRKILRMIRQRFVGAKSNRKLQRTLFHSPNFSCLSSIHFE